MKKFISVFLALVMIFGCAFPALAAQSRADDTSEAPAENGFAAFFQNFFAKIKAFFERLKIRYDVKKEGVPDTMNQNAIHMLRSVTDTIGDSFIITTADGKVIVIDGGHKTETDYFVEYLKAVTGSRKPHIDAWFLSHAHDDHAEVFLEVAENRSDTVSFDKVYANFPEASFYEGYDEWGVTVISEFNRLRPSFDDKVAELSEGDVFNIGDARFTVFYVFNPEWKNVNEGSTVMRMDLGGTSVMFTGDAETNAENYILDKWLDSGLLDCDYCKMSHHGQSGVSKKFYEAVSPEVCMWPTPTWVWDNRGGNLKTFDTRKWVEELGIKKNYKSFEGSQVIRLIPRIVTTTDVFEEGYSPEKAADRLATLGYEGIDMGFDYWTFEGSPFMGDDYIGWAKRIRAHADEVGIPYTHAHAPGEADNDEYVRRSIEAAAVLGARYLVIHPIWKEKNGSTINSRLRFIQVNAAAIRKWLPKAEECGVNLVSENILWGASADPRIIAELVKEVNSPYFGWCFDVGHAWCSGYSPDIITKCAVTPVSVHIQDNDGSGDGHLNPGDGTIDFDVFIKALRDTGYLGDCVLEAHHQSLYAPDEERDAILARLAETAEPLRDAMY